LGEPSMNELISRGHLVVDAGPWSLSRVSAVARDPVTGLLRAGANARGMQGYAAGR
jgi:gamma-glutamyltranspeptidase / glutathione hydrolase